MVDKCPSRQGLQYHKSQYESIFIKSSQALKKYGFFFEWFEEPSSSQLNDLIMKINGALADIGCLIRSHLKKNYAREIIMRITTLSIRYYI